MQGRLVEVIQALGSQCPPNFQILMAGLVKVTQRGMLTDQDILVTMPFLQVISQYVLDGEGDLTDLAQTALPAAVLETVPSTAPLPPELAGYLEGGTPFGDAFVPAEEEPLLVSADDAYQGDATVAMDEEAQG